MRSLVPWLVGVTLSGLGVAAGCSSAGGNPSGGFGGSSGGAGGSVAAGSGGVLAGGAGGSLGGSSGGGGVGGKLTTTPPCSVAGDVDADGDGFTPSQGDCNECTRQMNPGAYDYPGNGVDEDCNGTPDDEPTGCDNQVYDVGYADPFVAAQVIGLCRRAQGSSWGVMDAKFVKVDGAPGMNPRSHGLTASFGPLQPRDGASMLLLSSGTARLPGQTGYQRPVDASNTEGGAVMGTASATPGAYPVPSPSCPNQGIEKRAWDPAALELTIRVPTNANQFSFDFDFYTAEYPNYICQEYNDFFIALVNPTPPSALEGNISFDAMGNPVSVNAGFLEVCQAGTFGGRDFPCLKGTAELQGTGFERNAATGWLVTTSPAPAGQVLTIRFAIWDAGDPLLDSTVVIDHFVWDVGQGLPPTTRPVE